MSDNSLYFYKTFASFLEFIDLDLSSSTPDSLLKEVFTLHKYSQNKTPILQNSIVVARDQDNVIGKEGTIYWNLPKDMQNFKQDTLHSIAIMGRVTFMSLPKIKGFIKPLVKRFNVVISRYPELYYDNRLENVQFCNNLLFVKSLNQAHIFAILLSLSDDRLNDVFDRLVDLKFNFDPQAFKDLLKTIKSSLELKENFITTIGGAEIYKLSLDKDKTLIPVTDILLTEVNFMTKPSPDSKYFTYSLEDYYEVLEDRFLFNGQNEPNFALCIKRHLKLKI
ncbi:hypothetical protein CKF54_01790 [Psittacicella hinzii]|uniref:dihydrofolate reductase n=1 Tax=Psittacicella hinzii TaxID=2028575 RepID=A0A3A1YAG8_9GAMM|nr:dihydrofolate reductase [Psittacicella hinzii]RIY34188.1 hypothetical protein CKF54_01790 [Psittacicella hinzii]